MCKANLALPSTRYGPLCVKIIPLKRKDGTLYFSTPRQKTKMRCRGWVSGEEGEGIMRRVGGGRREGFGGVLLVKARLKYSLDGDEKFQRQRSKAHGQTGTMSFSVRHLVRNIAKRRSLPALFFSIRSFSARCDYSSKLSSLFLKRAANTVFPM